ncbi:hypothetical protein FNAPI_12342 [Fusarium napiforme]|uniref:Uncharacterized protein n=1 Tax=Fusarium napiforme TaxID=42672 RepID=A0A8H5ICJ9_9HYPO|nr:hypothetical protein FNAPI_12342 [Fusarium napiforme]
MAALSRNCNDTATANRGSISFERTPGDLTKIETRIGSMCMQMTNNTYKGRSVRSNAVTRAILHAIQCMVDISDMVGSGEKNITAIIFTDVLSVTYDAVITLVFRCFSVNFEWDPDVTTYMTVDKGIVSVMNVYEWSRFNVETVESMDPVMSTHMLLDSIKTGCAYVIAESESVTNMILLGYTNMKLYMSVLVDVNTYHVLEKVDEIGAGWGGYDEFHDWQANDRSIKNEAVKEGDPNRRDQKLAPLKFEGEDGKVEIVP